jgi:uncharacterized protein (TIRG00374 family)
MQAEVGGARAKRTRGRLLTFVKLALVVALMAYVLFTVQWRDSYTVRTAEGATLGPFFGSFVGGWDRPEVEFRPSQTSGTGSSGSVRHLRPGSREDGSRIELAPGLPTYLRSLDPWLFAAGGLCYLLVILNASSRWWWLLRLNRLPVSWIEALRFTWIGLFFNNFVPGQTGGDLVKGLYIMKRCPGARIPALVSVVVDRALGLTALAILAGTMTLFALQRFAELALAVWGLLALIGFLTASFLSRRVRRWLGLSRVARILPPFLTAFLERLDQAVLLYRGHKVAISALLFWSVLNHALSVTSVLLIGQAMAVGLPPFEYFVLVPVIGIISSVPLGPNGWGVGELAFGHLFATYGAVHLRGMPMAEGAAVMRTRGVALSVVFRLLMTVWSLLGGLLLLKQRERVTREDVAEEIALERAESAHVDSRSSTASGCR